MRTGVARVNDPYANREPDPFSGCNYTSPTISGFTTFSPGVICGGLTANSGADIFLNPGIYYIDRGLVKINGGAKIRGSGVTIVFTSSTGSNYATFDINGGADIALTPPQTGPTQGIVFFGDRGMPQGTFFQMNGGGAIDIRGAVYLPRGRLSYSGNGSTTATCLQVVVDTATFTGNSNLELTCPGVGITAIGDGTGRLVE